MDSYTFGIIFAIIFFWIPMIAGTVVCIATGIDALFSNR